MYVSTKRRKKNCRLYECQPSFPNTSAFLSLNSWLVFDISHSFLLPGFLLPSLTFLIIHPNVSLPPPLPHFCCAISDWRTSHGFGADYKKIVNEDDDEPQ